jgi:hypothetical protein
MDNIQLEENVENAVNTAIVEMMGAIRKYQIDQGPSEYIQPHVQLLQLTAEIGALRLQQDGLATLLSELAGEDEVFSDNWLTVSSCMHALDSVFDQMYCITKVYTSVIGDIGSTPELTQKMVDKADEIVAKTKEESPEFDRIYTEFISNADVKPDDTSEDNNP